MPGLNWQSWTSGNVSITAPSSPGTDDVWVRCTPTTSDSKAINDFKNNPPISPDEVQNDRHVTSIRIENDLLHLDVGPSSPLNYYAVKVQKSNSDSIRVTVCDSYAAGTPNTFMVTVNDYTDAFAVEDVNGNGREELAIIDYASGKIRVRLYDTGNNNLIRTLSYLATNCINHVLLPDTNSNGSMELAIVEQFSSTQIRIVIMDTKTGAWIKNIYAAPKDLMEIVVLPDVNGNGVQDIGIVDKFLSNRIRVLIYDPSTGAWTGKTLWCQVNNYQGYHLMPDLNGNGSREFAIMDKYSSTQYRLISLDLNTKLWVQTAWFNINEFVDYKLITDINSNGVDDIGILDRWTNGYLRFLMYDGKTRAWIGTLWPNTENYVGMEELGNINGMGGTDLIFVDRFDMDQVRVIEYDAKTKGLIGTFTVDAPEYDSYKTLPDINGNGAPELLICEKLNDGQIKAMIYDTKTRSLIGTLTF